MTQATLTPQLLTVLSTLVLIYTILEALEAAACTLQTDASAFCIKQCICQETSSCRFGGHAISITPIHSRCQHAICVGQPCPFNTLTLVLAQDRSEHLLGLTAPHLCLSNWKTKLP